MNYQTHMIVPVHISPVAAEVAQRAYRIYEAINRINRHSCHPMDYDEIMVYLSRKQSTGVGVSGHGFEVTVAVRLKSVVIQVRAGTKLFHNDSTYLNYRLRLVERIGLEESFSITIPSKEGEVELDPGIFSAAHDRVNQLIIDIAQRE